jgi:hypothetical protein
MKKHLKFAIQMDEHNTEEEMEITENVPKNIMNNHWKENSEQNTICHMKKTYSQGKKLPVTGRNLPPQKETSYHRKNLPVT